MAIHSTKVYIFLAILEIFVLVSFNCHYIVFCLVEMYHLVQSMLKRGKLNSETNTRIAGSLRIAPCRVSTDQYGSLHSVESTSS